MFATDKFFVRARHPQSFGISNILLVPCPYLSVAFFFQNGINFGFWILFGASTAVGGTNLKCQSKISKPHPLMGVVNLKSKIRLEKFAQRGKPRTQLLSSLREAAPDAKRCRRLYDTLRERKI
ncbi:hypothetical protein NIES37_52500 [Tolypothrix tenuis PCC 7101]|uniref:Uncharacterized protein n=1 Tax=Tolypothrix tenuis PCC 7101 TaxID=231146 RepID=A0A1Z4N6C8_9CYAN|nr:hypothetical protein [Aulosira sp. FACHB-113]BAZ01251.1 hypothetical protein NIES37_52500 [Tolypothrix tenuis PCC 7101]BAZ74826.1 hypothetical protein NIES50_34050 [Aulosira laxa NIES-50]